MDKRVGMVSLDSHKINGKDKHIGAVELFSGRKRVSERRKEKDH